MGVEKTWKLIKAICLPSVSLSTFLGIRTALGEEHCQLLLEAGFPNAFICKPVVIKVMWDGMQERHQHTLSCCVFVSGLKNGAADGVD